MTKLSIIFVALMIFCSAGILAVNVENAANQYTIDSWSDQNGLAHNNVKVIVQTHDRYLWLGTHDGLSRFDGGKFFTFNRDNTPEMINNSISALFEDSQRNLWIGTRGGGLLVYKNGRFRQVVTGDGFAGKTILWIAEGSNGNILIGTNGNGLYELNPTDPGGFTRYTTKEGLAHDLINMIHKAGDGTLWIATKNGLSRFNHKENSFTNYIVAAGNGAANDVDSLYEDTENTLWIGTYGGLYRMRNGEISRFPLTNNATVIPVYTIIEDSQKNIWIGTRDRGLFRYKDGVFTNISKEEWLFNDRVYSILEDRNGSLWTGMSFGGLSRLRAREFNIIASSEGLTGDSVVGIYQNPRNRGSFWINTYNGLNRWQNGKWVPITTADGLSSSYIFSICEDSSGTIWVGTENGLDQLQDSPSGISVKKKYFGTIVRAILEDGSGNLWVGTDQAIYKKDKSSDTFKAKLNAHIISIHEDNEGNLWLGTFTKGLFRYEEGRFTPVNGLNGRVHSFYSDRESVLWVATDKGLSCFRNGAFENYSKTDGLFADDIFQVTEDKTGNLWMISDGGLFRIRKEDLNAYRENKINSIPSVVYGPDNRMESIEYTSGFQSLCKTADGKLWFATNKGALVIDPANIKIRQSMPPVIIERVLLDGVPQSPGHTITVKPGTKQVEIHYTAMEFLNPKKVTFRYKLTGYEERWVDARDRRVAAYTNLSTGMYHFDVTASVHGGRGNVKVASISIEIIASPISRWMTVLVLTALVVIIFLVIYFSRKYMRLTVFWKNQTYVGNFKLLEKVGIGGMGTVYKAENITGKRKIVAVKLLKEELFEKRELRERFKQEALIIDQLDHPNIVKVIEREETKHTMFIVMEFLSGKTLAKKIEEEGRIDVTEGLDIMIQIANAVTEIHSKNIIHRDLKPGNIMLIKKDTNPNFVKLLDFGLAKLQYQTQLTRTGIVIGTISYMAPEQLSGSGYSSATDVYSMGVLFHEMLTGEQSFGGENSIETLRQIMDTPPIEPIKCGADIPGELNRLVVEMMAKNSQARPDVGKVVEILRRVHSKRIN
ncbi:MAG: protein kinase [bacterium]|nr:protein kinase [bacterium]